MIGNREVYVESAAEVPIWDRVMFLRVLARNERASTASVEVCLDGGCFVEEDFLGYVYSTEHQSLVPYADLALISAQGHKLAILMGLRKWIALPGSGSLEKEDIFLNRNENEDSGFYSCQLLQADDGVIAIYESGVVKIGWDGRAIWTRTKFWDDAFAGVGNHLIKFVNDSSGTEFHLDLHTGYEVFVGST